MSLHLPSLFSDHMVFQRSPRAPVWGWAAPCEQITVALANAKASCTTDTGGRWLAELNLEKSGEGMAVLLGLGDALDVHPRNKKEVGERLARLALARNYGQKIAADSPRFAGMKIENGRAKIRFHHADGALVARPLPPEHVLRYEPDFTPALAPLPIPTPGSELQGFVICGADRNWKWAQAKITGADSVEVWSADVPEPVAVRYAWADNPTCNLFNKAGLPAMPFRTDDFPL